MSVPLSCPFSDRDFVLFINDCREIDWYGKRSYLNTSRGTTHKSYPENQGGRVRGTNGGNALIASPIDDNWCQVFGLTTVNYNGWMDSFVLKSLFEKKSASGFRDLKVGLVKAYEKYYKNA